MFNQSATSGAKRAADLTGLLESLQDPSPAVCESNLSPRAQVELPLVEILSSALLTTMPLKSRGVGLTPYYICPLEDPSSVRVGAIRV